MTYKVYQNHVFAFEKNHVFGSLYKWQVVKDFHLLLRESNSSNCTFSLISLPASETTVQPKSLLVCCNTTVLALLSPLRRAPRRRPAPPPCSYLRGAQVLSIFRCFSSCVLLARLAAAVGQHEQHPGLSPACRRRSHRLALFRLLPQIFHGKLETSEIWPNC